MRSAIGGLRYLELIAAPQTAALCVSLRELHIDESCVCINNCIFYCKYTPLK